MDFMPSVLPVIFQPTIFLLTLHAPENKLMPRASPLSATCDVVNKTSMFAKKYKKCEKANAMHASSRRYLCCHYTISH